jgi:hypothetical protein
MEVRVPPPPPPPPPPPLLTEGSGNTKSLTYTSLVRLILEYGVTCRILAGIMIIVGNLGAGSKGEI